MISRSICASFAIAGRFWAIACRVGDVSHLDGDAGDFVGALLDGGEVVVTGNAGNYTGIGMKTGLVQIGYSTGKYTGEGMRGGTLRVGGRIAALGRVKQGAIYEGDVQVFPAARSGATDRAQTSRQHGTTQ